MQISVCVSVALLSPLPTQPCWLPISLLTFIAYSSLSVASPRNPPLSQHLAPPVQICLPHSISLSEQCLNLFSVDSLAKSTQFSYLSRLSPWFLSPRSWSKPETAPFSRLYLLFVQQCDLWPIGLPLLGTPSLWMSPSLLRSWHATISETKASTQTDKTWPQSDLWTFELSVDQKCTEPVKTATAGELSL